MGICGVRSKITFPNRHISCNMFHSWVIVKFYNIGAYDDKIKGGRKILTLLSKESPLVGPDGPRKFLKLRCSKVLKIDSKFYFFL